MGNFIKRVLNEPRWDMNTFSKITILEIGDREDSGETPSSEIRGFLHYKSVERLLVVSVPIRSAYGIDLPGNAFSIANLQGLQTGQIFDDMTQLPVCWQVLDARLSTGSDVFRRGFIQELNERSREFKAFRLHSMYFPELSFRDFLSQLDHHTNFLRQEFAQESELQQQKTEEVQVQSAPLSVIKEPLLTPVQISQLSLW